MTERFEEAVRQAAQGLGSTTEIPTYHQAWQRGRRRRLVKRSALAAAGVLVFIAALSVNLGRLPGTTPSEIDEVVIGIEAATPSVVADAPTPLATTEPLVVPTVGSPEAAAIAPSVIVEATPTTEPTTQPPATATPAPASGTAAPATAEAIPPATSVPADAPTPQAQPSPQPTTFALEVAPTPTPQALLSPEATGVPDGANSTQQTPDTGATIVSGDEQSSQIAATEIDGRPDAVILERQGSAPGLACDIDRNGSPDATCELLPDYRCTGDGDINAGYGTFDDDEDGVVESCRAVGLTMCDTTGDGFGDTPCIIDLNGATEPGSTEPGSTGPPSGE